MDLQYQKRMKEIGMTKQDFEFFAKFAVDHNLSDTAIDQLLELFIARNDRFSQKMWWKRFHYLEKQNG